MSIKSLVSFSLTCAAVTALVGVPALAADPAVKCESGKLKESGKYGFCRLKAESVAVKKGLSLDYSKCDTKFSGKWDKLELKGAGECPSENDFADLQNRITEHTDLVSLLLSGVGLGNEDPDAVYVATPTDGGADTATCGSQAEPCATIAFGLQPSTLLAKLRVYVAGGEFFEDITLSDGIDVLGGFDPDSWESAPGTNPTILYGSTGSSHRAAVTALNITSPTSFDGFVVYAAPATTLSSNSYGVYVSASSAQLVITNNVIFANSGAAGGDGVGGAQGQIGMDGDGASPPGADAAYDAFIAASAGFCNAANNRQFANGGFRSCGGDNVSGGAGGGNQCAPVAGSEFSGIDGAPGSGTGGGPGGDAGDDGELLFSGAACSVPPAPTAGREGSEGAGGSDGLGGT
ncbi:MAG TPA: hypothetical protein EYQ35_03100, partial [candidate division UBP10 bacterium]|nr:hypothetical protein [Candidatus Binatota bacterium]